jgi:hypothetical protein
MRQGDPHELALKALRELLESAEQTDPPTPSSRPETCFDPGEPAVETEEAGKSRGSIDPVARTVSSTPTTTRT